MKTQTLIIATIVALTGFARAASLEWGFSMDSMLYVKDGTDLKMATDYSGDTTGWMFCLVHLGSSSSLDVSTVTDASVVDHFDYGVYDDNGDAYPDPFVQTFATTGSADALDGSTVSISAGDYFGIVFYDGSKYSNVMSVQSGEIVEPLTATVQLPSLGATANTVYHYIGEGGNIAVVPEPSVALLGLLGLGMLLKRRKA